jgi:hypothetical protein
VTTLLCCVTTLLWGLADTGTTTVWRTSQARREKAEFGRAIWQSIQCVSVMLVSQRCPPGTPQGDKVARIRTHEATAQDIAGMKARRGLERTEERFASAIHAFATHREARKHVNARILARVREKRVAVANVWAAFTLPYRQSQAHVRPDGEIDPGPTRAQLTMAYRPPPLATLRSNQNLLPLLQLQHDGPVAIRGPITTAPQLAMANGVTGKLYDLLFGTLAEYAALNLSRPQMIAYAERNWNYTVPTALVQLDEQWWNPDMTSFLSSVERIVVIRPISKGVTIDGRHRLQMTQLPLVAVDGTTMFRLQGLTLQSITIGIPSPAQKQGSPRGYTYTADSRVPRFEDVAYTADSVITLDSINETRFAQQNNAIALEYDRLQALADIEFANPFPLPPSE